MRKFTTLLVVAGLTLAVLLCPGCKKRGGLTTEESEMSPVSLPGPEGLILPEDVPRLDEFREPENTEVFQDIHFDFDRSDVRQVDRPILQGIADYLQATPDLYLLIEGHCDERGTSEYNLALGERRALSTREFLAGLGVNADRMVTITLGEEDPINPGHDEAAWAENRRAHFKIAEKSAESTE
jgi:peptidoglycan-associated lipoprotein